ncbi:MAG TPA: general secretion pathway protein GspB [Steroidobacteraceae bacterium]|jgi:general secretion pathway protein B|nr:general secretion pathway protein GspB [Steroidobacteraceae bacterium]
MSFILDALKKSEIERQRQSVPGLMDTRSGTRRRRLPLWAAALGLLLGINLVVLALVLWNKSAPSAAAPRAPDSVAPPAPAAAPAQPPVAEHFSPLDTSPVYAPEIPVAATEGARKTAVHAVRHSDPILSDQSAEPPAESQEVLPSISEINLTGAQALPDLHLDVHVYATNPADRFVYINMRKYHEGAALPEGPRVERIRRDGVVLNYQGLRFILPRQP